MWFLSFLKNVTPFLLLVLFIYFFYLFIFSPFDKFRLLFVSSFLAHSSSKGNLQQLEFRESKETQ